MTQQPEIPIGNVLSGPEAYFALYDYRRCVARHYRERAAALEAGTEPAQVWQRFRKAREELFAAHAQSALDPEQRQRFQGLPYFPYNPGLCVEATLDTTLPLRHLQTTMNADESMSMVSIGRLTFTIEEERHGLQLYWLEIYGGGLFLPFRDTTSPAESYGGGRYLFDTIKGSDFISAPDSTAEQPRIQLDFNYAYNPSCAYNAAYVCPLAPLENRLSCAIRAGEQKYPH